MKLPRPLSHSSISLYQECPQKYKFKYVDGIPEKPRHFFSFGQSMHLAVEFFYGPTLPLPPSLEELLAKYKEVWISAGYRDPGQELEYFEEGKRILHSFHKKHSADYKVPLFIEYAFNFEVDGVPVTGRIDRIDKREDGRLDVLDYKTGKQLPAARVTTDSQLTMYQLACEKLLGAEVNELSFYHLPSLKEHKAARRPSALIDELKTRVVSTAESITKELFEPRPEEMKCRWCDYKPICPIYKDQYAGAPAPAAKAAGEPELAALVDRYGDAQAALEKAKFELEKVSRELGAALKKKGYVRAFGERFEAALTPAVRWEFVDKKKVLELLKKAGVYEKVLAPSAPLVNKLMEDAGLDADLRARVSELGERVDAPEIKVKPL